MRISQFFSVYRQVKLKHYAQELTNLRFRQFFGEIKRQLKCLGKINSCLE